ncbi:hypothetical protein ABW05_00985 [Mycolicibacterium senegalense]|uniref:Uncharacterized protein n=1 Tax=Mycolicibacterium senegalense TaxID=1796 RepID=A0ABR5FQU0_9MYCO|nr:hypothetical protein AA982_15880 [Mycolicibacterium senegalense]KLO50304.1 hypothetical protein ABW05_00985 [Mycolicibacterium senegalense]
MGVRGELICRLRCAALRSVTGLSNVTVSGIATPTTEPAAGAIDAAGAGVLTAADATLTVLAAAKVAAPIAANTFSTEARTVPNGDEGTLRMTPV